MTDNEKFDRLVAELLAAERRVYEQRMEWLSQNKEGAGLTARSNDNA